MPHPTSIRGKFTGRGRLYFGPSARPGEDAQAEDMYLTPSHPA
jgi:hypothetical protein